MQEGLDRFNVRGAKLRNLSRFSSQVVLIVKEASGVGTAQSVPPLRHEVPNPPT